MKLSPESRTALTTRLEALRAEGQRIAMAEAVAGTWATPAARAARRVRHNNESRVLNALYMLDHGGPAH